MKYPLRCFGEAAKNLFCVLIRALRCTTYRSPNANSLLRQFHCERPKRKKTNPAISTISQREFRLWRISAHSAPCKQACRSPSGRCEPDSRRYPRRKDKSIRLCGSYGVKARASRFCRSPKGKTERFDARSFLLVDLTGIEPVSKDRFIQPSP